MTSPQPVSGIFIGEGSSDAPLARIIETMFLTRGVALYLSDPDFGLLEGRVAKDVRSRVRAGLTLVGRDVDLIIVHRDADNVGPSDRRLEILGATEGLAAQVVPIVPVRMTEAWLLLDERAIRTVAGNPNGKQRLELPNASEAERIADPKHRLQELLVLAAAVTGRRHQRLVRRFNENRRQLLERLDDEGAHTALPSWIELVSEIDRVVDEFRKESRPGEA